MKLLANENFPLAGITYLEKKGFDIKGIGVHHPGYSDIDVISLAISEDRLILTFDRDYGELIFKHGHKPNKGVIYLRLSSYRPQEPGEIIEDLINSGYFNFDSALTVVETKNIRQRKY